MFFFKKIIALYRLYYFYIFEVIWYAFFGLWITEKNYFYKYKVFLYFCRYHLPALTNPVLLLHLLPYSLLFMVISFIFFLIAHFFIYIIYCYFLYLFFWNLFEIVGAAGIAGFMYYFMVCYICYIRFKRERKNIEEIVKTWEINQDSTFLKPKDKK